MDHALTQLTEVWNYLGVFRWFFVGNLSAVGIFLVLGWHRLMRLQPPATARRALKSGRPQDLVATARRVVGRHRFAAVLAAENQNERLWIAERELSRLDRLSGHVRFLAGALPAIGLLGTLMGMFQGFSSADFSNAEGGLGTVMETLMQQFSLALWTTIAAVSAKFVVDYANHFTLAGPTAQLDEQLGLLINALAVEDEQQPAMPLASRVDDELATPVDCDSPTEVFPDPPAAVMEPRHA